MMKQGNTERSFVFWSVNCGNCNKYV